MVLAEGPFLPRSATNLGGGNVYDRGFYRLRNRSECSREMNRIWHSQRRCGVLAYRLAIAPRPARNVPTRRPHTRVTTTNSAKSQRCPLAISLNPRISIFMFISSRLRPAFFSARPARPPAEPSGLKSGFFFVLPVATDGAVLEARGPQRSFVAGSGPSGRDSLGHRSGVRSKAVWRPSVRHDPANSSTPFPYSVFHLYVSTLSGRVNVRSNDPDLLAMKIHALFAPLRLALERGRRPFSR